MKIKLFVSLESQYFEPRIFSFNLYVYCVTRDFIISTRAFNLPTCAFNLPTRDFNIATDALFELVTRGFELATPGLELVTRRFELLTRKFELVTRVLLFHFTANNLFCRISRQFTVKTFFDNGGQI